MCDPNTHVHTENDPYHISAILSNVKIYNNLVCCG